MTPTGHPRVNFGKTFYPRESAGLDPRRDGEAVEGGVIPIISTAPKGTKK